MNRQIGLFWSDPHLCGCVSECVSVCFSSCILQVKLLFIRSLVLVFFPWVCMIQSERSAICSAENSRQSRNTETSGDRHRHRHAHTHTHTHTHTHARTHTHTHTRTCTRTHTRTHESLRKGDPRLTAEIWHLKIKDVNSISITEVNKQLNRCVFLLMLSVVTNKTKLRLFLCICWFIIYIIYSQHGCIHT